MSKTLYLELNDVSKKIFKSVIDMLDLIIGMIVVVIGLFFAVGSFYLANVDKKGNKYEY